MVDAATLTFAWEHRFDDAVSLMLQKHPGVNLPAAAQQIEGWQTARIKWPSLATEQHFLFPPRLNREQASSEATAQYKAEIAGPISLGADLTGGMGIDSLFLSKQSNRFDYIEQNPALYEIAKVNLHLLRGDRVSCHNTDCIQWLQQQTDRFDLLFIDPARRDDAGRKVSAFEHCQPNLLQHLELLMQHCDRMMVKASPMIDLNLAISQLQFVNQIHIVAVHGECKEVLFMLSHNTVEPEIICTHLMPNERTQQRFLRSEEQLCTPIFAPQIGHYLYEPNPALMKGGAFALICQWFEVMKLDRNTHLYTSDSLTPFPGRRFEVMAEVALDRKALSPFLPDGKAHVIARNYPVAADRLQQQLKIKEGGDCYIIATTLAGRKTAYICESIPTD